MLNRYLRMKREERDEEMGRGPVKSAPNETKSVAECEQARTELVKDISKKIAEVQNRKP